MSDGTREAPYISYATEAVQVWDFMLTHYDWVPAIFPPPIKVIWDKDGKTVDVDGKEYVTTTRPMAKFYVEYTWLGEESMVIAPNTFRVEIYHKTIMDHYRKHYKLRFNLLLGRLMCWHMFIHEFIHYIDAYEMYQEVYTGNEPEKAFHELINKISHNVTSEVEMYTEKRALQVMEDMIIRSYGGDEDDDIPGMPCIIPVFDGPYARKNPLLNASLAMLENFRLKHMMSYDINTLTEDEFVKGMERLEYTGKRLRELKIETGRRNAQWRD